MSRLLKNCLASIFEHQTEIDLEVIVVDNNSNDGCGEMIEQYYPKVEFIQTGGNLGYAKGNNIGLAEASGDYVMLLNPDTVFLENIFDDAIEYLEKQKKIGLSTLRLTSPNGEIQHGAWNFYRLTTPIYQRTGILKNTKVAQKEIARFTMQEWDRRGSRDVPWVQSSCVIARKEALNDVGLLDERFFLYFSDVDWSRRFWEKGWRVHYYADLPVIHYFHRESAQSLGLKSLLNPITRIHIKDWLEYLKKYWPKIHYQPFKDSAS